MPAIGDTAQTHATSRELEQLARKLTSHVSRPTNNGGK